MLSEQPCGTQRQPPREARLDTVKLERIVARGVLGRDSWAGGRGRTARPPGRPRRRGRAGSAGWSVRRCSSETPIRLRSRNPVASPAASAPAPAPARPPTDPSTGPRRRGRRRCRGPSPVAAPPGPRSRPARPGAPAAAIAISGAGPEPGVNCSRIERSRSPGLGRVPRSRTSGTMGTGRDIVPSDASARTIRHNLERAPPRAGMARK